MVSAGAGTSRSVRGRTAEPCPFLRRHLRRMGRRDGPGRLGCRARSQSTWTAWRVTRADGSTSFPFDVPGGRWQTMTVKSVSAASWASRSFRARVRWPLEPPASVVISAVAGGLQAEALLPQQPGHRVPLSGRRTSPPWSPYTPCALPSHPPGRPTAVPGHRLPGIRPLGP